MNDSAKKVREILEDNDGGCGCCGSLDVERATNEIMDLFKSESLRADKLKRALQRAWEQFALMADGEGSDHKVYMQMSNYAMKFCDEAVKEYEEGK